MNWRFLFHFLQFIPIFQCFQLRLIDEFPAALTDDIQISWTKNDSDCGKIHSKLDLYLQNDRKCTANLNGKLAQGIISFPCQCFAQGNVNYQIANYGQILLNFSVYWPKITLKLPEMHVESTTSVLLTILMEKRLCSQGNKRESPFLEVQLRLRAKNRHFERNSSSVVFKRRFSFSDTIVILSCQTFVIPGIYSALLFETNSTKILTNSNKMAVIPFPDYHLQMRSDSIFPHCMQNFIVGIVRPPCPLSNDRIRLFAGENNLLLYMGETVLHKSDKSKTFSCSIFDIIYRNFCFELVSIFSNGRVEKRTKRCISTEPKKYSSMNAYWASWSHWSSCFGSCGLGFTRRFRICHNQKPTFNGDLCQGEYLQTNSCILDPCPNTTMTSQLMKNTCTCGCNMEENHGIIVISTGECPKSTSFWTIFKRNDSNELLHLRLINDNLQSPKCHLRINNGQSSREPLLYDSKESFKVKLKRWVLKRGAIIRYDEHENWQEKGGICEGAIIEYEWKEIPEKSNAKYKDNDWAWNFIESEQQKRGIFVLLIIASPIILPLFAPLLFLWLFAKRRILIKKAATVTIEKLEENNDKGSVPLLRRKFKDENAMVVSTRTESTRLSTVSQDFDSKMSTKTAVKRTIENEPISIPPQSQCDNVIDEELLNSSSVSIRENSEQDFEYDYSFLRPIEEQCLDSEIFSSEFDIDRIIGDSELMKADDNDHIKAISSEYF